MAVTLLNRAKDRLKSGRPIGGFGITMAAPALAQILACSGADYLNIDLEHGAIGLADVHTIVSATAGSDCTPIARVSSVQGSEIKPVLDAGVLGIVFPMVRTRADVETGINATLYPPIGNRGIGPHHAPARWQVSAADYVASANDAMLNVILIETPEAVENIEDLLTVPHLDAATIAVGDLAANLGAIGNPNDPRVADAIHRIEKAILQTNVALGGVASSPEEVSRMRDRGYRLLVLGFDVGLISKAAARLVEPLMN